jgi:hypothetical protein
MGIFEKGALARHIDPLNISGIGKGKRFDIQNALMSFDVLDLAGDLKKAEAAKRYKQDVAGYNAEQQAKKAANVRVAEASSAGKKLKKGGKVSKPRGCGVALRGYGKAMK